MAVLLAAAAGAWAGDAAAWSPGKDGGLTIGAGQTLVMPPSTTLVAPAGAGAISITVNTATGIEFGDVLLLYQAQGATFDASNTATYGTIGTLGNAGRYEFVNVIRVAGADVEIEGVPGGGLRFNYDAGRTQVLRVPQLSNLTVRAGGAIVAGPWNGGSGGIVALLVQGTATIDGTISASNAGFRGGAVDNLASQVTCLPIIAFRGVGGFGPSCGFDPRAGVFGGEKGEGIGGSAETYDALGGRYGRGAAINGAGGANSHGAGGGGGANGGNPSAWTGTGIPDTSNASWVIAWNLESPGFASRTSSGGGRGGYTFSDRNEDPQELPPCDPDWGGNAHCPFGGLGGRPLPNEPGTAGDTRLFFGGGGGAGDGNENDATRGGAGGGFVFVLAGGIAGSGGVSADGESSPTPRALKFNDGAGGGGAGGAIVLVAEAIASSLSISAIGGTSLTMPGQGPRAEGPGGGGGGGYVAVRGGAPTVDVRGGSNGTSESVALRDFPPDGATRGGDGISATAPPIDRLPITPTSQANLTITVSDQPADGNYFPGQAVTYAVVAGNEGPSPAGMARVRVPYPPELLGAAWTCGASAGGACPVPANGSGPIDAPVDLAPGATVTFTISATVSPSATVDPLVVPAFIDAPSGVSDPFAGDNAAEDSNTPGALQVDVAVDTRSGEPTYTPGLPLIYEIDVSNTGPSTAFDVLVTDDLPGSIESASWSCQPLLGAAQCGVATGEGSISADVDLPPGSVVRFRIDTLVDDRAGDEPLVYSASAAAPPGVTDTNPANNQDSEQDGRVARSDLVVAITDDVASVLAGGTLSYRFDVANGGPSALIAVSEILRDRLPAGVDVNGGAAGPVALTGPGAGQWTCLSDAASPQTVACEIRPALLLRGAIGSTSFGFDATVSPGAIGTLTNRVIVVPPAGVVDANPLNNIATDDTTVTAAADLALTKTDGVAAIAPGSSSAYTFTVTNGGPSQLELGNVRIVDVLPPGVVVNSGVPGLGRAFGDDAAEWLCEGDDGIPQTVVCQGQGTRFLSPDLGGSTFSLAVDIAPGASGTLSNTATVQVQNSVDPVDINNGATDSTVVVPLIDLSLAQVADNPNPPVGTSFGIALGLDNAGPSDASNVVVVDVLPAGLELMAVGPGCNAAGTSVTCSAATLAAGAQQVFALQVRRTEFGRVTNVAQVTAAGQDDVDSTPGNNDPAEDDLAQIDLPLATADLSLMVSGDNPAPLVGSRTRFTLLLSNAGPDGGTGIVVRGPLPDGYVAPTATATQGSYDVETGTWLVGDVGSGGDATLTLEGIVGPAGPYSYAAQVENSDAFDPDSVPNNSVPGEDDTGIVPVAPRNVADLSLFQAAELETPSVGTTTTLLLLLRNDGPSLASGVTATVQLSPGLTVLGSVTHGGGFDPASGTWSVGSVPTGSPAQLLLTVSVDAAGPQTSAAQISTASALDPDSTPANNDPSEDDQANLTLNAIGVPLIGVGKAMTAPMALGGDRYSTTVMLTVQNYGGELLTGVEVLDPLTTGAGGTFGTYVAGTPAIGQYTVSAISASGLMANAAYTGEPGALVVASGDLPIGARATVQFSVQFGTAAGRVFVNQASASAVGEQSQITLSDLSTAGSSPDPDGDNIPDEGTPSAIVVGGGVPPAPPSVIPAAAPWMLALLALSVLLVAAARMRAGPPPRMR